ncbi:MAG TPA: P-II family nitrogen regulator [Eubacteriales bacterium]|jgi:nitrogen regulatory protein PII|nr:P-II family nitrogen regulator [Eubacteriales bacterium]HRU84336.1 P-II family nitrogen regulator [Eubacteriales bacterium]
MFDLIVTIVARGYADLVMEAAKEKGARGGTVITGRGTGQKEAEKFFNIILHPERELVLMVVASEKRAEIMEEITQKAGLKTVGQGITFSLPVDEVIGLTV